MTGNFQETRSQECQDFRFIGREFVHAPTGARVCWLANKDQNRTFAVTFRTPPSDCKGTPHILEHSVLCGSRSFPLRDPFAVLLKSSLHTFLNAFTAHHYTSYPVASQNPVDFRNLVTVYLDAVFHPLLTKETYLRQAWHYETKGDSELVYKGVVYNEMKGRYADASGVLYRSLVQNLFPDTLYRFDSGGDPEEIPALAYNELLSFHSTYYHPSNAYVYAYGDIDIQQLFDLLDGVFSEFKKAEVKFDIGRQSQFKKEKSANVSYVPSRGESDGLYVVSGWKVPYDGGLKDELRLLLLEKLLVGSQASTLYKALMGSGLGDRMSGFGLIDVDTQAFFSTGLKGVKPENERKVRDLIFSTLESVREFSNEEIEGVVNSFEFRMREQISNSPARGIQLLSYVTSNWIHRNDPFFAFTLMSDLSSIREEISSGDRLFEPLIGKHFLENLHRVDVTMTPDQGLSARKDSEESARLQKIQAALTKDEIASIAKTASLLDAHETESEELVKKIPVLKRGDLERSIQKLPYEINNLDGIELLTTDVETSGITYAHIGFNLNNLDESHIPWLTFFSRCLVSAGTKSMDYAALTQRIQKDTGGISSQRNFDNPFEKEGTPSTKEAFWFFLDGSVLNSKREKLFAIFEEMLLTPRFTDQKRITQIYREMRSSYEEALVSRPLGYAIRRARGSVRRSGHMDELAEGFSQLSFLRSLEGPFQDDFDFISAKLEELRESLVARGNLFIHATSPKKEWDEVMGLVSKLIRRLPNSECKNTASAKPFLPSYRREITPSKTRVSYVSVTADVSKLGFAPSQSIDVVLNHVKDSYLWDEIRVKGGAYGATCGYDRERMTFGATSWDDPQPFRTVEVMENIGKYLLGAAISDDEVERNVIGMIGALDQPVSPMMQGMRARAYYQLNHPPEVRQERRDRILSTTAADFKEAGEALLGASSAMAVSIFGPNSDEAKERGFTVA